MLFLGESVCTQLGCGLLKAKMCFKLSQSSFLVLFGTLDVTIPQNFSPLKIHKCNKFGFLSVSSSWSTGS